MHDKEWKKYKLSDITSKLGDGLHGTPKYDNNGEYYFINGNNLENGKILIKPDTKRVSFTEYQKYKKELNNNTILLSINGTLGNIGYYNNEKVILGKSACYFNLKDGFSKDYVRYIMSTKSFKLFLENFATGATIKNVSLDAMRNFEFYAPRKDLQDKIAKILSNYDNLIENNNKRIKILEEIAQKIYKEWFVDFKFPGHETATFKDSPMGKIPTDWEVSNLENILSCIESGSRPKGGINSNDTEIPSVGAENIIGLGKYDYNKEKYISNEFYKKMKRGKIQDLDVLLYKDGAQLGRKSIFGENFPHSKCCINEHVFILRTNEKCSQYYLYFTLDTISNTERIKQLNTNAAQPGINQEQVKGLTIILPQRKIIEKFDDIIGPIVSEIFKLCIKNQTLKQTRDLLLPHLISGEIDVENMEIV